MIELPSREDLYELFPRGAAGAEIGVCTGRNAARLYEIAQPKQFHLVDLWPSGVPIYDGIDAPQIADWALIHVCNWARQKPEVRISIAGSLKWLQTMARFSLDWVYLDTNHEREHTLRELRALDDIVEADGMIAGHDYHDQFGGVIEAVTQFTCETKWRLKYVTRDRWPSFGLVHI